MDYVLFIAPLLPFDLIYLTFQHANFQRANQRGDTNILHARTSTLTEFFLKNNYERIMSITFFFCNEDSSLKC